MLIRRSSDIEPSEITDQASFFSRRDFMRAAAGLGLAGGLYRTGLLNLGSAHAATKLARVSKNADSTKENVTLLDPAQMPGQGARVLQWPYVEGLRMDEAMHPLTLLTLGLYGEVLPNQNGAPVRVVVPWKYGFKSAKAIVKIRFTQQQPRTSWELAG